MSEERSSLIDKARNLKNSLLEKAQKFIGKAKAPEEEIVDMKEVKRFFLEAAANTYAADIPKTTIAELPRSKVLRYEKGDFLYIDLYFTSPHKKEVRKSLGLSIVFFRGMPVWGEGYGGMWNSNDERTLPFLKRALMAACQNGEFVGGRGPELFREGNLEYQNRLWRREFEDFNGDDEIWEERKLLFHHHYEGMSLL